MSEASAASRRARLVAEAQRDPTPEALAALWQELTRAGLVAGEGFPLPAPEAEASFVRGQACALALPTTPFPVDSKLRSFLALERHLELSLVPFEARLQLRGAWAWPPEEEDAARLPPRGPPEAPDPGGFVREHVVALDELLRDPEGWLRARSDAAAGELATWFLEAGGLRPPPARPPGPGAP